MVKLGYIYTDDPIEAHLYIQAQDIVSYARAWKVHKNKHEYHNEEACIRYAMVALRAAYNLGAKGGKGAMAVEDLNPQENDLPLSPSDKAD